MTTSLILSEKEWQFALSGEGEPDGLCDKGFAKRDEDGNIVLGPELRMIAQEYGLAAFEEIDGDVTVLRGERFCMLIESYPLIRDTLKITLLKDADALDAALAERGNTGND